MSPARKRFLALLAWAGLVALSLRPVGPVEAALDLALAPLRLVAELASPLWVLRAPEVRAARGELLAGVEAEARAGEELLASLARHATPSEPALVDGRRLVHAEVVGRVPGNRDRLTVRLRDARGVVPGLPVVNGSAYVGRVIEVDAGAVDDVAGTAVVELVTARRFHVGARVDDEGRPIDMTVGGIDPGNEGRASERILLAVHNPSDRSFDGGLALVRERLGDVDPYAHLADGYRLGRVHPASAERNDRWVVEPELDYLDGIFHVVVLAPPDGALPSDEPMAQALADRGWVRARPVSHGDPTAWRESLKLSRGIEKGVSPGAAVAYGARLIGRVTRAGLWGADVSLLGDPGLTVVAVARFEDDDRPFVLGRLVSLGRDPALPDGVLLRWSRPLDAEGAEFRGRARLFTGSGDPGMPSGLFLGEAELLERSDMEGAEADGPRILRLYAPREAAHVREVWVRVEGTSGTRGGS